MPTDRRAITGLTGSHPAFKRLTVTAIEARPWLPLERRIRAMRPSGQVKFWTKAGPARMDLKKYIRDIPDFPKPGILFHDISTLLADADAWQVTMGRLANRVRVHHPDILAGVESRGFLLAAPLALKLGCGFVMLRKRGKLPGKTIGLDYALEYGTDRLEIQEGAIKPGQRVVIVDDLLATGGTLAAGIDLLHKIGADVAAAATIIELSFLKGRERLNVPCETLVDYQD
ncbi:Adenine phosphoribosyltransferase [Granulibacter bethesdensis]|nr:Adenine phosphoribosyltransferase [Granulibacter bethesdensis]